MLRGSGGPVKNHPDVRAAVKLDLTRRVHHPADAAIGDNVVGLDVRFGREIEERCGSVYMPFKFHGHLPREAGRVLVDDTLNRCRTSIDVNRDAAPPDGSVYDLSRAFRCQAHKNHPFCRLIYKFVLTNVLQNGIIKMYKLQTREEAAVLETTINRMVQQRDGIAVHIAALAEESGLFFTQSETTGSITVYTVQDGCPDQYGPYASVHFMLNLTGLTVEHSIRIQSLLGDTKGIRDHAKRQVDLADFIDKTSEICKECGCEVK